MIGKSQPGISQTLTINRIPAGLRDQIRANPNIPKTFLLDVAKLESEEGMRAKLKKYLRKESSPAATVVKPPRKSSATVFMERMDSFQGKIADVSWRAWTPEEQEGLAGRLRNLRRGATELLQKMDKPLDDYEGEPDDEDEDQGESEDNQ
jgi:hypothetical protein